MREWERCDWAIVSRIVVPSSAWGAAAASIRPRSKNTHCVLLRGALAWLSSARSMAPRRKAVMSSHGRARPPLRVCSRTIRPPGPPRGPVCTHDGFPFGDRVHRVGHGEGVERPGGQQPARMLHRYAVGLSDVALVADDLVEHGLGRRQTADHVGYALPSPRCLGLSIGVSWACSTTWRRSSSSSAFTIGKAY